MASKTWKVAMFASYYRPGGEESSEIFSQEISGENGLDLERRVLSLIKAHLIMVDDERFEGPGTPISTTIDIQYL